MPTAPATAARTVPEPCRILGTVLRPFCLGHHLLFKRLGLPFVDGGMESASPEDVLTGVAICAGASYETTLNAVLDGTWAEQFVRWSNKVRRKHNSAHMSGAVSLFGGYLIDGYTLPPMMETPGANGGIGITAPWECLLKVSLIRAGFSESEVLNGYLPCRWYDYLTDVDIRQHERGGKTIPIFYSEKLAAR